jgi:hypothetical protein
MSFLNDAINWLEGSDERCRKASSISNVSGSFHKDSIMRKLSYTILKLENSKGNNGAFRLCSCKSLTKLT